LCELSISVNDVTRLDVIVNWLCQAARYLYNCGHLSEMQPELLHIKNGGIRRLQMPGCVNYACT